MTNKYEKCLVKRFSNLDTRRFRVQLGDRRIFVCGGLIDVTSPIPPSFRHRFVYYLENQQQEMHNLVVLAEKFKDYFKDGIYPDLLEFEEDIANTCSIVVIFLESSGSLVELGMFCNQSQLYNKLLIVAPREQTRDEDSFIYLGPLEYIKKKNPNSVAIYDWPLDDKEDYSSENLEDLFLVMNEKLSELSGTERFDSGNPGHVTFLICEIIRLCFPILQREIRVIIDALDLSNLPLIRYLYLLKKLRYIDDFESSTSYKFYYPLSEKTPKLIFGTAKKIEEGRKGRIIDNTSIINEVRQSFVTESDRLSKQRFLALRGIIERLKNEPE